jgi:hypothetical protein
MENDVKGDAVQSGEIDKLAVALVAAQAELTNPPKTKTVHAGVKKYSFAPLPEILDAVRPVLKKHGLAVVQLVRDRALETRVLHTSGQWIGGAYSLPGIVDSQAMGSAITYARRYSLCAVLGIAGEDDEDGEAATAAELDEQAARRKEAEGRLDAMKGKGKIKSAYDGKVLAPGEATLPSERTGKVETADLRPQTADRGAQERPETSDRRPPGKTAGPACVAEAMQAREAPALPEARKKRTAETAVATTGKELAGIAKPLADLMRRDGVTPEALKRYYVVIRKHLPDTVEPTDLPPDYVETLVKAENWKKAVAAIKGGSGRQG